jgi:hypothetical protein
MDLFHILYTNFTTMVIESEHNIIITTLRPSTCNNPIADMLGYIRF